MSKPQVEDDYHTSLLHRDRGDGRPRRERRHQHPKLLLRPGSFSFKRVIQSQQRKQKKLSGELGLSLQGAVSFVQQNATKNEIRNTQVALHFDQRSDVVVCIDLPSPVFITLKVQETVPHSRPLDGCTIPNMPAKIPRCVLSEGAPPVQKKKEHEDCNPLIPLGISTFLFSSRWFPSPLGMFQKSCVCLLLLTCSERVCLILLLCQLQSLAPPLSVV